MTGTPAATATPAILMLPPDAPPQILWVQMSSTTPQSGDVVSAVVLTSSNVASVELRVGGYGFPLSKTDVGRSEGAVLHEPFVRDAGHRSKHRGHRRPNRTRNADPLERRPRANRNAVDILQSNRDNVH